MSRILSFDVSSCSISTVATPPGIMQSMRTRDGDNVWIRKVDASEGHLYDREMYIGSISASDSALTFVSCIRVYPGEDAADVVAEFTRPPLHKVIEAIVHNEKKTVETEEQRDEAVDHVHSLEEDLSTAQTQLKKSQTTHEQYKRNNRRKIDELNNSVREVKRSKSDVEQRVEQLDAEAERLRQQLAAASAARMSAKASGAAGSQPVVSVASVYERIMTALCDAYAARISRVSSTAGTMQLSFVNDSDALTEVTDEVCIATVMALATAVANWKCGTSVCVSSVKILCPTDSCLNRAKQVNVPPFQSEATASVEFHMAGYKYELSKVEGHTADFSSQYLSTHAALATLGPHTVYVQYNTQTKKKRLLVVHKAIVSAETRLVLAGAEFPCALPLSDVQAMVESNCPFDDTATRCDDPALRQLLATLGQTFATHSGNVASRIKITPASVVPLLKPRQLLMCLLQMKNWCEKSEEGGVYMRLVAHASTKECLSLMETDATGLDIAYCQTGCRQGNGNYVATTYDAGESRGYNKTGIRGKTLLCAFLSDKKTLDVDGRTFHFAYNFACNARASGRLVDDAICIYGNQYLLPLGIIESS